MKKSFVDWVEPSRPRANWTRQVSSALCGPCADSGRFAHNSTSQPSRSWQPRPHVKRKNGPDFVARAERILGRSIAVITGKREAHLAAAGVMCGFPRADGIVADLGGGSLEIIGIHKKKGPIDGVTLPLGGLRLIDLSGGNLKKAREIVDSELAKVDWLKKGKGEVLLCRRRNMACLCQAAYGLHGLSAERYARL